MIMPNTLRQKLESGAATVGTHFMFVDPDVPEIIGDTGLFDYGEFTAEYSAFDMPTLYHLARAAQCGNLPLMIKPDQDNQAFIAQAALGAGFKAVLFTDNRTPDDVDECHACIRPDTPGENARMGVKLRRPALASYDTVSYLEDLRSVVTCIMIEKSVAFDDIDAILERARLRNIDMTQWGPADFGFSKGEPGLMGMPQIRNYEESVIAKSLEYGIHPRIEIAEPHQAKRYIDLGVRHFCLGWDRFIYRSSLISLGEQMQELTAGL